MKEAQKSVPSIYSKANLFINSKYKTSLMANRVMAVSFAKINEAEEDREGSLTVRMSAAELRTLFNVSGNGLYDNLNKAAAELTGKTIGMSDDTSRRFKYIAVVTAASFSDGVFSIEYNKALNKYLKDINSSFTLLDLSTMLSFTSNNSFRLCEYLKSKAYSPKGTSGEIYDITVSVSELKMILGIINADQPSVRKILNDKESPDYDEAADKATAQQFTDFRDFKKRVMTPAIEEINSKSDMNVEINYLRSGYGGKVQAVNFKVRYKKDKKDAKEAGGYDVEVVKLCDRILKLIEEKITFADAIKIAEAAGYDYDRVSEKYEISKSKANIEDITGFMISALKNDYRKPVKKKADYIKSGNTRDYNKKDYEYFETLVAM